MSDIIKANIYGNLGADPTQLGNPKAIQHLVMVQATDLLVGVTTWAVAVFFIRASILALYIRLFPTNSFRIACYVTHGVNAAFFVSIVLAVCLICRPISFKWNHRIPGGTCGDEKSLDLYIGILNLLLDVTVIVLPMPVLWGLQMAVKKKILLSGMFGMGIVICIMTLIRIRISAENIGSNTPSIYSLVSLFTCFEILLGVINACLPVMKPVFNKLGSYIGGSWLSSIISGSIPIFIRPSKIGSNRKSSLSGNSMKRSSKSKDTLPKKIPLVQRWPSSSIHPHAGNAPIEGSHQLPPQRYADARSANAVFASPAYDPIGNPPLKSPQPLGPPKSIYYSPTKRRELAAERDAGFEKAIHVQKEWDVERGEFGETDRQWLVRGDAKC